MPDKRPYSARRAYFIEVVRKRRKKIREMAIEYKGGKCQICGYNKCLEAMEFHHIVSSKKNFGISEKGYTRGWEKVKKELDKCVMLCANCHRRSMPDCSCQKKSSFNTFKITLRFFFPNSSFASVIAFTAASRLFFSDAVLQPRSIYCNRREYLVKLFRLS